MTERITLTQHDTAPIFEATLYEKDDTAINLTGANKVELIAIESDDTIKINTEVTIYNASSGVVKYQWLADNVDTAGTLKAILKITWNDGTVETVPNDGYFEIVVVDDFET